MRSKAIARARLCKRLGTVLVWMLLCACGQSGDLYLPPDDAPGRASEPERASR